MIKELVQDYLNQEADGDSMGNWEQTGIKHIPVWKPHWKEATSVMVIGKFFACHLGHLP